MFWIKHWQGHLDKSQTDNFVLPNFFLVYWKHQKDRECFKFKAKATFFFVTSWIVIACVELKSEPAHHATTLARSWSCNGPKIMCAANCLSSIKMAIFQICFQNNEV